MNKPSPHSPTKRRKPLVDRSFIAPPTRALPPVVAAIVAGALAACAPNPGQDKPTAKASAAADALTRLPVSGTRPFYPSC